MWSVFPLPHLQLCNSRTLIHCLHIWGDIPLAQVDLNQFFHSRLSNFSYNHRHIIQGYLSGMKVAICPGNRVTGLCPLQKLNCYIVVLIRNYIDQLIDR